MLITAVPTANEKEFRGSADGDVCGAYVGAGADGLRQGIEKWRSEREANLKKETGWLTVAGLFWLKEGINTVGAGEKFDVRLTDNFKQGKFGEIEFKEGKAVLKVEKGIEAQIDGKSIPAAVDLVSDEKGKPTEIRTGTQTFFLIKREERFGIRLKDSNSEARRNFKGLHWFPIDESQSDGAPRSLAGAEGVKRAECPGREFQNEKPGRAEIQSQRKRVFASAGAGR